MFDGLIDVFAERGGWSPRNNRALSGQDQGGRGTHDRCQQAAVARADRRVCRTYGSYRAGGHWRTNNQTARVPRR